MTNSLEKTSDDLSHSRNRKIVTRSIEVMKTDYISQTR
jgi:hypothetical protein